MKRRDELCCLAGLALLAAVVLFYDIGAAALFEPDEGRNAEFAREMLVRGDWITPHYDFLPALDKPAGLYWLIAVCFKLFGVSIWSAHLPPALTGLGCVLLTYDLARERLGLPAALWASLILVTSPLFVVFARATNFDMPLTFFVTLALWGFARATSAARLGQRRWLLITGGAIGCAILVKGPVGALLPGLVVAAYVLWTRSWPVLWRRELAVAAVLALAIAASWYALAEWRNPGYLRYFLFEENVLRFLTPRFQRPGPWYYFLAVVVAGVLPWLPLLVARLARIRTGFEDPGRRLMAVWVVVPIAFFSLSESKLPGYILPVMPPLAILLGDAVARAHAASPSRGRWSIASSLLLTTAIALSVAASLFDPALLPRPVVEAGGSLEVVARVRGLVGPFVPVLLALLLAAIVATAARRTTASYVTICGSFAMLFFLAVRAEAPVSERYSSSELAARAWPLIQSSDQLVIYDAYLSSLPFYLRIDRPIWVVWPALEGSVVGSHYVARQKLRGAPDASRTIFSRSEFQDAWRQSRTRLLVFVEARRRARFLQDVGGQPAVLLTVGDTLIFANR